MKLKGCIVSNIIFSAKLVLDQWKVAQATRFAPLLVPTGTVKSGEHLD